MADLTINTQQVLAVSPNSLQNVTVNQTVNAGQPVYLNGDNLWYLALASGNAVQAGNSGLAITLAAAFAGQAVPAYINPYPPGKIAIGAAGVNGGVYVVSANAGAIAPIAELGSGNWVSVLGVMSNGYLVQAGTRSNVPGFIVSAQQK